MNKNKIARDIVDDLFEDVNDRTGYTLSGCSLGVQEMIRHAWLNIVLKHLGPIDSCQSLGGKTITTAKSEAARKNGAKGGRPKKLCAKCTYRPCICVFAQEHISKAIREAQKKTDQLNEIRKIDPESLDRPFTI